MNSADVVIVQRILETVYHEAGTLAFGRAPSLDHDLPGVRGIRVRPGHGPRSVAANPSLSTLALSDASLPS
ncbi:hypothetical protein AB0283_09990 [Micromonospora vinacea]|uniref:hypothetical protein n=1 Tax=Micromonospora vinacea TaxID=709878 RepID=UPI00344D0BF6